MVLFSWNYYFYKLCLHLQLPCLPKKKRDWLNMIYSALHPCYQQRSGVPFQAQALQDLNEIGTTTRFLWDERQGLSCIGKAILLQSSHSTVYSAFILYYKCPATYWCSVLGWWTLSVCQTPEKPGFAVDPGPCAVMAQKQTRFNRWFHCILPLSGFMLLMSCENEYFSGLLSRRLPSWNIKPESEQRIRMMCSALSA